jgi:hypothetical protein
MTRSGLISQGGTSLPRWLAEDIYKILLNLTIVLLIF